MLQRATTRRGVVAASSPAPLWHGPVGPGRGHHAQSLPTRPSHVAGSLVIGPVRLRRLRCAPHLERLGPPPCRPRPQPRGTAAPPGCPAPDALTHLPLHYRSGPGINIRQPKSPQSPASPSAPSALSSSAGCLDDAVLDGGRAPTIAHWAGSRGPRARPDLGPPPQPHSRPPSRLRRPSPRPTRRRPLRRTVKASTSSTRFAAGPRRHGGSPPTPPSPPCAAIGPKRAGAAPPGPSTPSATSCAHYYPRPTRPPQHPPSPVVGHRQSATIRVRVTPKALSANPKRAPSRSSRPTAPRSSPSAGSTSPSAHRSRSAPSSSPLASD